MIRMAIVGLFIAVVGVFAVAGDAIRAPVAQDTIYQRALDASVKITFSRGYGSGVVISDAGVIVTNAHVCGTDNEFTVVTVDGVSVKARLLWKSAAPFDLCLIEAEEGDWNAVKIRTSPAVPGEAAFAVGNPMGTWFSITWGHVVGLRQPRHQQIPSYQIDLEIGPGSSGGGLFDMQGRLIGITNSGINTIACSPYGCVRIPLGFNYALPNTALLKLLVR